MEEIWKPVTITINGVFYDFTNLYEVSNTGKIKTVSSHARKKEVILKTSKNNRGYDIVHLYKNNKQKTALVHRIVATAFVPNPKNLPEVDHIIPVNNGGGNNCENLRWVTKKENRNNEQTIMNTRGKNDKRSKKVVGINLFDYNINIFHGTREAERLTGAQHSNISKSCKTNRELNEKFLFAGDYIWFYFEDYEERFEIFEYDGKLNKELTVYMNTRKEYKRQD